MANFPEFLMGDYQQLSYAGGGRAGPSLSGSVPFSDGEPSRMVSVELLIQELNDSRTREYALQRLSKIREIREVNLAPLLWHSFGTIFTLLKEIIEVYHLLSTPHLTQEVSNRACNTIALLQCIAAHPETRIPFIKANMPLYLYPLLNTENQEKPHEYLRLSSLGVIGALVKDNDAQIIHFLLQTQVFYYCIHCMEVGTELSRTVATFIVERILINEQGLNYCCSFADRFFEVSRVLGKMVDKLVEEPSFRLLKLIVHCYLMLSEYPRPSDGLRCCIPRSLKDAKIISLLSGDPTALSWLQQLFQNIANGYQTHIPPTAELVGRLITG